MFSGLDVRAVLWSGTLVLESPDSALPLGRPSGGGETIETGTVEPPTTGAGGEEEIEASIVEGDKGGKIWNKGDRLIESESTAG